MVRHFGQHIGSSAVRRASSRYKVNDLSTLETRVTPKQAPNISSNERINSDVPQLKIKVEEEVVNIRKTIVIALLAVAALTAGTARAGEDDQAIKVSFSQAVEIPGHTLPAGTYWFVIMNTSDRQTVQILNADRSDTYAVLQTINRERFESSAGPAFTLAERSGTKPAAVVAWFYPGRTTGHEFLYPKQEERELAMAKQDTQISGD